MKKVFVKKKIKKNGLGEGKDNHSGGGKRTRIKAERPFSFDSLLVFFF